MQEVGGSIPPGSTNIDRDRPANDVEGISVKHVPIV